MQLKRGNLFSSNSDIIAHGVNCRGAFGSGVAGQIARLFPLVKEEYLRKHKTEGWHLGDVQFVTQPIVQGLDIDVGYPQYRIFANCATQYNYGANGVYVDYDAIGRCLNKVFDYAEGANKTVSIPKIGCGLAGGDWAIVSNIIQQCLQGRNVNLEVWEL